MSLLSQHSGPNPFYRDLGHGAPPNGAPEVVAVILEPWRSSWGYGGHLGAMVAILACDVIDAQGARILLIMLGSQLNWYQFIIAFSIDKLISS